MPNTDSKVRAQLGTSILAIFINMSKIINKTGKIGLECFGVTSTSMAGTKLLVHNNCL